ncbi:MAG: hypothetical protein AAGF23_19460 [Acidobacteriota bacterium]
MTASGPLLRIKSGPHAWAVRLDAVERVTRPGDSPIDREGAQALIHDDVGPVPLQSLAGPLALSEGQRILWLRTDEDRLAIAVDAIGDRLPSTDLHPLPAMPFAEPPPILGLAGGDASALPVLDLKQLSSPLPPAASAPSLQKGAALAEDHEAALMLLPPLGTAADGPPLTPAVSSAQVLGVEAAGEVTPLPSLPAWCLGAGWWLGRPVGVFSVARRLAPTSGAARGGRWLIAAMPGGGRLALEIDGRCTVEPLPERATVEPAPGPVGEAIYGLFETAEHRLALLDLERWQRASL